MKYIEERKINNFPFSISHFPLLLCAALAVCRCSHTCESVVADVDITGWGNDTEYSVVYDNMDSLSQRELSIFVFHERSFAAATDSLLLTVTTVTPDSLVYSEEWVFRPDRRRAEGYAAFHETVAPYRSRVVLGRKGAYLFTFSHRDASPVKGLKGIGITVK